MLKTTFDPAIEVPFLKAIIYGAAGAGKTHLASGFKGKILYLLTEPQGRSTVANCAKMGNWNPENVIIEIYSWQDWLNFLHKVTDEDLQGFDLIVLDTIDHLDDYNCQSIATSAKKEAIEQISDYGASRAAAISRLHQFVVSFIAVAPL